MQFQGQSHILPVRDRRRPRSRVAELRAAFEAAYWQRFGVELPEIRPVLVNLHTAVIGKRKPVSLQRDRRRRAGGDARRRAARRRGRSGSTAAGTTRRSTCASSCRPMRRFDGPAIVEQLDCTTVIEPGNRVEVDAIGNLIVDVGDGCVGDECGYGISLPLVRRG